MNRDRAFQLLKIDATINGCRRNVRVSEHFRNRGDRASALQQRGREAGAQQVRIQTAPRARCVSAPQCSKSSADPGGRSQMPRYYFPHCLRFDRLAAPTDQNSMAAAKAGVTASAVIDLNHRDRLGGHWHVAPLAELGVLDVQKTVWEHVAKFEPGQFCSAQPTFVQQSDHQHIAQAGEGSRIGQRHGSADLLVRKVARQSLRRSPLPGQLRQLDGTVNRPQHVLKANPRTNRLQVDVDRRLPDMGAAFIQEPPQPVLIDVQHRAAGTEPATQGAGVGSDREGRSTAAAQVDSEAAEPCFNVRISPHLATRRGRTIRVWYHGFTVFYFRSNLVSYCFY